MNIPNRIQTLEDKLTLMRKQWLIGSVAMKGMLERDAKTIKAEIFVLEKVLRKRAIISKT